MLFRNNYCVKETTNLDESLCGYTEFFGDQYNNGKCEYRKCSSSCIEGSYSFEHGGNIYHRSKYCCSHDYCNDAITDKIIHLRLIGVIIIIFSIILFVL